MDLYPKASELIAAGKPFAVATVVKASGSTPQKAGAKALFEPGGAVWGTIGGGCLEAESRRRAMQALDDGRPCVFDLSLDDDYGWDDGLICGGSVRVFVDPDPGKNIEAYRQASTALEHRESGVLVTRIGGDHDPAGKTQWIGESEFGDNSPYPGADVFRKCLAEEKPNWFAADAGSGEKRQAGEVFVEPVVPAPRLLIAGAGHIGKAMARLGTLLGFKVTVIDDRPGFVDAAELPEGARGICGDIAGEVRSFPIDTDTYIVIVTRGHRHDTDVLAACIRSSAAYIGMIGSKRKVLLIRKNFIEEGLATEAEMARVHAPIGLDIGAVTVEEIATSIAGQLVAVRRGAHKSCKPPAEAARP